jgi:hypothetical protein
MYQERALHFIFRASVQSIIEVQKTGADNQRDTPRHYRLGRTIFLCTSRYLRAIIPRKSQRELEYVAGLPRRNEVARIALSLALAEILLSSGLLAQSSPPPGYLSTSCIKVLPGKMQDYRKFVTDYSLKANSQLVSSGEITSWMLLRSVIPAGEEARCDYISVTTHKAEPLPPLVPGEAEKILQKAGINMTWAAYTAKRIELTRLVATELWRTRDRVGSSQKGDYLYLNYMKVHNPVDYLKFEHEVWRPLAESMVKDGSMRAWSLSTLMLPGGTDRKYAAVSADVFPSWEAVFKPGTFAETFKKTHPDKNIEETMSSLTKLRDLGRRELFVIQEKVAAAPTAISQK